MYVKTLAAVALTAAVAACGVTPTERAVSGGALGAGTGAAAGAITGDPLTGALIGGGTGAVAGAVTDPNDVYLGEPAWDRRW